MPTCGLHLRSVCHLRARELVQPIPMARHIRLQRFSTDESTPKPNDLINRVSQLEKFLSITMEDRFKKLKHELKDELTKSLEKNLMSINDEINDLRAWIKCIVGTFGIGIMLQLISTTTTW